jgi:hypothetical protein
VSRRRWWVRTLAGLVVFGVLEVVFTVVDFEPHALRLGMLVALCVVASGLLLDSLGDSGATWASQPMPPLTPPGSDHRLAAYVRLVEGHLTAAAPDQTLRDRLRALCDERLERRRGLSRGDPAAEALLGADLLRDLAAPPRRFTGAEIDDYLRRIEEL